MRRGDDFAAGTFALLAFFLLLGETLVPQRACGACTSTEDCLREIRSARESSKSFTARFVQTKRLSLLEEPLVSKGRFVFEKPDRMVWEIEEPEPLRIALEGGTVEVPGLSPEEAREIARFLRHLESIFSGDLSALRRSFSVEAHERDGAIELRLRPREEGMEALMEEMELRFNRPGLLLRRIRLRDSLGDELEIRLDDYRMGAPGSAPWPTAGKP